MAAALGASVVGVDVSCAHDRGRRGRFLCTLRPACRWWLRSAFVQTGLPRRLTCLLLLLAGSGQKEVAGCPRGPMSSFVLTVLLWWGRLSVGSACVSVGSACVSVGSACLSVGSASQQAVPRR